jgi:hypothetical protein
MIRARMSRAIKIDVIKVVALTAAAIVAVVVVF